MALSKTAKQRIRALIAIMKKVPRKHFGMGDWFVHYGKHDHPSLQKGTVTKRHLTLCGTSACALGWAAVEPKFKRLGLSLVHDGYMGDVFWKGSDIGCFEAGARAFDINYEQSQYLFCEIGDITPKQWAKKAAKYIKEQSE